VEGTLSEFQHKILDSTPPRKNFFKENSDPTLKPIKMVQITDIHMDIFYTPNVSLKCGETICCRPLDPKFALIDEESDSQKSGYWGTLANCDVPPWTVEAVLKYIGEKIKPDIVVWLGDNIYSKFINVTKNTETDVLVQLTEKVKKFIGNNTAILPVIGNHEAYPIDTYNYHDTKKERWIHELLSSLWKDFFTPEALEQFNKTGYYTQLVKGYPNLRVIGLNAILYIDNNAYSAYNSTDPLGQIEWLSTVLSDAEKNNERVIMLTHVPTCCDRGTEEATARMMTLLERYANIMVGVFAGHYHREYTRLLRSFYDNSPYGFEFIGPSISTFDSVNTAFLEYELDPVNYHIREVRKHLFDITESNKQNKPIINLAYNYTTEYGMAKFSPSEFEKFVSKIRTDADAFKKYAKNFGSDGPSFEEIYKHGKLGANLLSCLINSRKHSEWHECVNYNFCIL